MDPRSILQDSKRPRLGQRPRPLAWSGFRDPSAWDFNNYPHFKLDRRLIVLLYLNRDWPEDLGHLDAVDHAMQTCQQRILPLFKRTVCFSTTDTSLHGHPDPLRCPERRRRRSLAPYYYSNGRSAAEVRGPIPPCFSTDRATSCR